VTLPKGSWRKMVSQPTGEPTRKNAARLKYDVPFGIGNYFFCDSMLAFGGCCHAEDTLAEDGRRK